MRIQVGFWQGVQVGGFRKKAGIKYPKAYADSGDMSAASPEKKEAMNTFNCAQRAHGNFLENQPSFVVAMLVAGLRFPVSTALMGAGWIVSRVLFALGYTNKDKPDGSGRMIGAAFWLFQLGVFGLTSYTGVKLII